MPYVAVVVSLCVYVHVYFLPSFFITFSIIVFGSEKRETHIDFSLINVLDFMCGLEHIRLADTSIEGMKVRKFKNRVIKSLNTQHFAHLFFFSINLEDWVLNKNKNKYKIHHV